MQTDAKDASQTEASEAIERDGKYIVDGLIAKGGYGVVYAARTVRSRRQVAIKIAPKVEGVSTLVNEARIIVHLQRRVPTARISGYGEIKDTSMNYLAMERMGIDLAAWAKRREPDDGQPHMSLEALDICTQLLAIVRAIHGCGFVYRDVKPSNFVFGTGAASRRLHVIDFGMMKRLNVVCSHLNSPGANLTEPIGTRNYASVNAHTAREHSRKDDLESLAYLFFWVHSGDLPWSRSTSAEDALRGKRAFRASRELERVSNVRNYLDLVDALDASNAPNYDQLSRAISYIRIF